MLSHVITLFFFLLFSHRLYSSPDPSLFVRPATDPASRLGISELDQSVQGFFANGLAPATRTAYRSFANWYRGFCAEFRLIPLPLSQDTITCFVAYLARSGLTYQSIRSYLAGVHFLQIGCGLLDPDLAAAPVLNYVLHVRGVRRSPPANPRTPRLPITLEILGLLFSSWSQASQEDSYNATMLWAARCTAFFGFLRAGEFTCSSLQAFEPFMLGLQDVTVDSHENPSVVTVHLRHSKADPFGSGVRIYLGRTGQAVCLVSALLGYLVRRGQQPGPLFLFQDRSTLSKQRLLARVNATLACQGFDTTGISGHSFCVGAATTAARVGMEDSLIQTLGRWRSSAYLRYNRMSGQMLASNSARLLTLSPHTWIAEDETQENWWAVLVGHRYGFCHVCCMYVIICWQVSMLFVYIPPLCLLLLLLRSVNLFCLCIIEV